jgi:hypothetical protein
VLATEVEGRVTSGEDLDLNPAMVAVREEHLDLKVHRVAVQGQHLDLKVHRVAVQGEHLDVRGRLPPTCQDSTSTRTSSGWPFREGTPT